MSVEELIARLEAATHPSRALDLMICRVALNSEPLGHAAGMTDDMLLSYNPFGPFPHYTLSIDAALTLVPDDVEWLVRNGAPDHPTDPRPYAHITRGNVNRDRSRSLGEAHHSCPALALCIAALRARAAA
jgi:hypothetical protein